VNIFVLAEYQHGNAEYRTRETPVEIIGFQMLSESRVKEAEVGPFSTLEL